MRAFAVAWPEPEMLFYHPPTRRFVVIDLKLGPFEAECAGKMNLYVNAVDALIAGDEDRATVGFILCADRNKAIAHLTLVAEFAARRARELVTGGVPAGP